MRSYAVIEGQSEIGSTLPLAFSVVGLHKAAGQFNGWVSRADDPKKNGSVALTVSETGKIAAKVQAGGKTYAFSKTGYDAETNGTVYVRLEASVTRRRHPGDECVGAGVVDGKRCGHGYADAACGTAPSVSDVVLFRNNWKDPETADLASSIAGY